MRVKFKDNSEVVYVNATGGRVVEGESGTPGILYIEDPNGICIAHLDHADVESWEPVSVLS